MSSTTCWDVQQTGFLRVRFMDFTYIHIGFSPIYSSYMSYSNLVTVTGTVSKSTSCNDVVVIS